MLIRVFLLASNSDSQHRLAQALKQPHVHMSGMSHGIDFWEELGQSAVDIVVADLAALPSPATGAIHAMRQLPEAPDVIIISDDADPEQRASLQSAGAMAVLFAGLSSKALKDTLAALVDRRCAEASELGAFTREA